MRYTKTYIASGMTYQIHQLGILKTKLFGESSGFNYMDMTY